MKESLAKVHLNDRLKQSIAISLDTTRGGDLEKIYANYTATHHTDIFLEEPENNLFPPTQCQLADWLIEKTKGDQGCTLFVATHSPYFLTSFLEKNLEELALFLIETNGNASTVKTASQADIQEIYDSGIDSFFNIAAYT